MILADIPTSVGMSRVFHNIAITITKGKDSWRGVDYSYIQHKTYEL